MSSVVQIKKNQEPHSLLKPWEKRSTYCGRMIYVPVIGYIIRAIIWLFKKIFPCCFPKQQPTSIPKPKVPIPSKLAPIVPQEVPNEKIEQNANLERVLKLPPELRSLIIKDLNYRDLTALQMALQSDKSKTKFDPEKSQLKILVQKTRETDIVSQKRILNKILLNISDWWQHEVNSWTKISVQDKVWLLQMYELFYLGRYENKNDLFFPEFKATFNKDKPFSSGLLLHLLKYKREMAKILASIKEISFDLKTLPDAVYLLSNLEKLTINNVQFEDPFEVSKFVKLKELSISKCSFKTSPDFSKNVHLEILQFEETKLTIPPDVSQNLKLKALSLKSNQLKTPPDVSQNINLEGLAITKNPITTPPNVTGNPNLQLLGLTETQLIAPPDVSRNPKLEFLFLNHNQLTIPPDLSECPNLESLFLNNNQLIMPPDVSQNLNLEDLALSFNPLTSFPDVSQHQKLGNFTRDQQDPGIPSSCTIL